MLVEIIMLSGTLALQMFSIFQRSRCTNIRSDCCCCHLDLTRKVPDDDEATVAYPVSQSSQEFK